VNALAAAGVGLLGLALMLAWALWRQRRRNAALQRRLDLADAELQQLQQACARLAPAGVVDRMLADGLRGGAAELPFERREVTVLFSDLVGFTALSEQLDPAVLARVLDGYFQRISDAVHAHSGHVSTWLGDGMLAYFGALRPNPWQCADAVRCALEMSGAIRRYNEELAREGLPPLALGIGIHRGPGLAGMIGSRERREYGFVGRTVNLAARVQTLTRTHGVEILVTEAVRAGIGDAFVLRAMPAERVKGIEQPVLTWAVLDVAGADPAGDVQHP